ncbi:PIN domain-containing protein, partial [Aquabacterium sp. UBA2148]|uniref:PIN domain-containing protein n=1 Tax=Aquabacterium sp. UBA2148 TaxID=1946042 RepID=UPI00257DD10E
MPLPKPPTKRADMLSADDYSAQPKASRTPTARAAKTASGRADAANQPTLEPIVQPQLEAAPKPKARPKKTSPAAPAPVLVAPAIVAEKSPTEAPSSQRSAPPAISRTAASHTPRRRRPVGDGPTKLFVLDTNVLLHDPMSLFRFDEHDVYLPMITLEELDGHKKGMTEVARNARQVSRDLDSLAADMSNRQQMDPASGIPLNKTGHAGAGGKLYFQTTGITIELPMGLPQGKADNQILGVVQALRKEQPEREVVLVSKDINMRIKARAMGLQAEDYFNDKTLEDGDLL